MPTTNYYTANGRIRAESTGGTRTGYLPDALGSVTATVQDGAVVNTYRYKPSGELLAKTGAGADPKFQWNGTHGYRQTGLPIADTYIRARHYNRSAGQWITTDPRWPTAHPYGYVSGNPISHIDPSGQFRGKSDRVCNDARGSCAGTTESACEYAKGIPNFPPDSWNPPCGDKIETYVNRYCRGQKFLWHWGPYGQEITTANEEGITSDVIRCMVWAESSGSPGITNSLGREGLGGNNIIPTGLMQWKTFESLTDPTNAQCNRLEDYHGCPDGGIPLGNNKFTSLGELNGKDPCDNLLGGIYMLCNCKYKGNVNRHWPKDLGRGEYAWGTRASKNSPFCCCMCGFGKKQSK